MIPEGHYKCSSCGEVFKSEWSSEEASKELQERFPDVPKESCDLVCEDCYKKILALMN